LKHKTPHTLIIRFSQTQSHTYYMNTISRFKFVTCFVSACRLQAKILCEINEGVMKLQYTISQLCSTQIMDEI